MLTHLLFGLALLGPIGERRGRLSDRLATAPKVSAQDTEDDQEPSRFLIYIQNGNALSIDGEFLQPPPVLQVDEGFISDLIIPDEPILAYDESFLDENNESEERTRSDMSGAAYLFSRYTEQVQARIERAWRYPPNAPEGGFRCTAEIEQTRTGDVVQITLVGCDDEPEWQVSLVKAVEAAVPLPAPPNEKLFRRARAIALSFAATSPYQAADSKAHSSEISNTSGFHAFTAPKSEYAQGYGENLSEGDGYSTGQSVPTGLVKRIQIAIRVARTSATESAMPHAPKQRDATLGIARPAGEH